MAWVGVVVDLADDFFGVPGQLDLTLGVAGGEQPDEPFAAVVGEPFGGDSQQSPSPVERVGLRPRWPMVSFCTRRRHSSSAVLATRTTWNGSATWTASGSIVSNTVR